MDVAEAKRILRGRENHPTLYMPLDLPEFADWHVKQPCTERARMIEEFIREFWAVPDPHFRAVKIEMLDMGCHTGWFVRHFHRRGWNVCGVEQNPQWREVARWAHRQQFPDDPFAETRYKRELLLDERPEDGKPFDVVLALSMLMYPFREGRDAGLFVLRRLLNAGTLVFIDFGGQYACHLPFDESNCIEWMLEHGGIHDAKLLGHSDFEHRPLFAFW